MTQMVLVAAVVGSLPSLRSDVYLNEHPTAAERAHQRRLEHVQRLGALAQQVARSERIHRIAVDRQMSEDFCQRLRRNLDLSRARLAQEIALGMLPLPVEIDD